jgi:hypothetical protein
MSLTAKRCSKLNNGQIVSSEGFTQKTTASVATKNCLNDGVHPTDMLTKLLNASSSALDGCESSATNRAGYATNSLSLGCRKSRTTYSA